MPISMRTPVRRVSQNEFGDIAFEVMRHVFAIHNEIGRFFDERIYKQELAKRMPDVRLEEPINISFESFCTTLFIDVLVGDGGPFEFKAVQKLASSHRMQLLNYLLLCDLAHGKVINVRPENVEHEFVNSTLRPEDRRQFAVDSTHWNQKVPGAARMLDLLVAIMRDWGVGLGISLYEDALLHFFQPPAYEGEDIGVLIGGCQVGTQRLRLIAPGVALKLTALTRNLDQFEDHARRLLAHLDLNTLAWANFDPKQLTLTTLEK